MMAGLMQDQNLEKQIERQIGCMSGFLQIFDRQQILAGKRIHSTKRLLPSAGVGASQERVKNVVPPAGVKSEAMKPVASPNRFQSSPAESTGSFSAATPPKTPVPLPMFELKEGGAKSSWKFCKEMPRLSLDSRATVDSKGRINGTNSIDEKQRSSPSVIARLMGLEPLPSSDASWSPEAVKHPELRRSASESRISRDLFHSRFMEGNSFQTNKQSVEINMPNNNVVRENALHSRVAAESMKYSSRNLKSDMPRSSPWRSPQQRRSFYDSADFFPEQKQTVVPMYGDSGKNLKMRGIDERSKDLDSLKQILEVLQLKGLLHSKRPSNRDSQRNFVYDRNLDSDESKIVLVKPWRSATPDRRFRNDSGGVYRYTGESLPLISPRRERGAMDRSGRSPMRSRTSASPTRIESNSIVKKKPLSIETQRRSYENYDSRRSSPINSPKLTPKRNGSEHFPITNRSPRSRKQPEITHSHGKMFKNVVTEDESSSISESTVSSSSQAEPERLKTEEYREGRSLLERCDKLLNSIAEMNSSTESQPSSACVIPSPISVLDSAFDKDESSSPSPVLKRRSIDFKEPFVDLEDEIWSSAISPVKVTKYDEFILEDSDFIYISEVLRASRYLPEDSGVFFFLEKQRYLNGNHTSEVSKLHRKLVFDVTHEIIHRNSLLPPWEAISFADFGTSLNQIWSEFQKIRERETTDDLLELICGVLKKDLAGNNGGWGDQPVEMSEAVLDIERLIFKDLVSETIRDLAELAAKFTFLAPRRKLVF